MRRLPWLEAEPIRVFHGSVRDCYNSNLSSHEWTEDDDLPYLASIKKLAPSYKTLYYLADWMQVGTVPSRWGIIKHNPRQRSERERRTNVTFIEQKAGLPATVSQITSVQQFEQTMDGLSITAAPFQKLARIFIIEDLSRAIVEHLGSRFGIDPLFFREQINDRIWQGTGSLEATTPDLYATKKRRKWFRTRNVRLRYHQSNQSFQASRQETDSFNVYRRADDDRSHWEFQDAKGAIISTTRTKTNIWIGEDKSCPNVTIGIVLVDPTVSHGFPMWYDRANWLPISDVASSISTPLAPSGSWYKDITHMTVLYPWFDSSLSAHALDLRRIVLPPLYTVCAEWLIVCEYVKTRLGQVEWMMEMPALFVARGPEIDRALKKLNVWRRQVPAWRDMIHETLDQSIPAAKRLTLHANFKSDDEAFEDIEADFKHILHTLDRLQARVDRLSDRGNAEMQLEAARQSLAESHDLARLTWLATIFVPLTFMSGIFSMTDDVASLKGTYRIYFAAAIPVAVVSLIIASGDGGVLLTRV
ncbi:hypothetical protein EK21DRAFT_103241 [Setomelanomma holmii]|uniref:Uncharacterized protein n=1 Tax=Setomelanomma holmii TaxID=210430 RepID=A0A9P4H2K1_9PLEO|nr:hypothetical protein EK21DRAFT_103241 [Setomelanomma holmii]